MLLNNMQNFLNNDNLPCVQLILCKSISKSLLNFTWQILCFANDEKVCQVKKEFISNNLA
jgi:hypothetical protein